MNFRKAGTASPKAKCALERWASLLVCLSIVLMAGIARQQTTLRVLPNTTVMSKTRNVVCLTAFPPF